MLNLGDFFAPLNISNLIIFFLFIASCDIVGYWLARSFIGGIPYFLRGAIWLLGLGVVVFIYFLSHYFVPYSFPTIFFILVFLLALSIKYYIKDKALMSLLIFLKSNVFPLFIILLILPQVFIKSSQPPYVWDEMAYHFISPYTLYFEKVWDTGTSFYMNLPRLMDTAFVSLFSLTKTYSISRLLSFSVFMSFLLTCYTFLKEKFGIVLSISFFVLILFYLENYLLWSTFGYVDIGTTSFVMIGFILLSDYFFDKNFSSLQFGLVFFGMGVGSKYSALTQFLSFIIISTALLLARKDFSIAKSKKLLVGLILFFILGGYWYLKNFIITGNPIYPILFGCKFNICENIDFGYTLPFTFANILPIYTRVFLNNIFLQRMFVASVVISLTFASEKIKKLVLLILSYVIVEIILVRNISGFEGRYFYHWQILAILIIVTPLFVFSKVKVFKTLWNEIRKKQPHEG